MTNFSLAHDLRVACMRLTRRVRYQAISLPPHQFTVIATLAHEKLTASELAEREQVSAPSMSRTVGDLVERGMITREVSTADRRRHILTLTESGHAAFLEGRRSRDEWMTERIANCTPEERETLTQAAQIIERMIRQ